MTEIKQGPGISDRRKLPIGIQTFRKMREENCYYVDKTPHIQRLIDEGSHYFLSRPRRFGKSLFLDTIKELFEGNEPLFEGLYIHEHWDWRVRYPVVRLSFGRGNFKEAGYLQTNVMTQLHTIAEEAGIAPRYDTPSECFGDLIRVLHRQGEQRVVVLVDEYDKPILDALDVPEVARANRDFLRGLYATIKDSDAHIKFAFLTGVSKFSKVSLFSGLNNLKDITLDVRYSSICGYTDADLDTVFAPELPGLDRDEIRRWYNGSYFASVGFDIVVEDSSSYGRLDMAVRFNGNVYLFEFKVVELAPEGAAMAQLRQKGYVDKYRDLGEPIHLDS